MIAQEWQPLIVIIIDKSSVIVQLTLIIIIKIVRESWFFAAAFLKPQAVVLRLHQLIQRLLNINA